MVDARLCLHVRLEVVERAVLGEAQTSVRVRVVEYARRCEDAVYLVVLVDVEVAGEHDGSTLCYLANLLHNELCCLAARHYAHMIHVQVEVVEAETGLCLLKLAPRADAYARSVPAQLRLVGRFVQPEVALVEQLHAVFLIEYGGIFALCLAVVAAHADIVVAVECAEQVAELRMQHFLRAEDVGTLEVHLVANHLAACLPHVAVAVVVRIMVAYVV